MIPGHVYRYQVQALIERGGEQLSITKTVILKAGSDAEIKFAFADAVQADAMVTLRAPDQASMN